MLAAVSTVSRVGGSAPADARRGDAGKTRYSARIKRLSQASTLRPCRRRPACNAARSRADAPLRPPLPLDPFRRPAAPAAVVARAAARGVDVLALTDHDEVGGLAEARGGRARRRHHARLRRRAVGDAGRTSRCTSSRCGIDPDERDADRGPRRDSRRARRARPAHRPMRWRRPGIAGAYEGAMQLRDQRAARLAHAFRALSRRGRPRARDARTSSSATSRRASPGYVAHAWATLAQAVDWIHAAGGQAVIAHPGRYKVTPAGMRRLLAEFRDAGGDAIEVLSPSHTPAQYAEFATHARVLGLARVLRLRLARPRRELDGPGRPARPARGRGAGLEGLVAARGAARVTHGARHAQPPHRLLHLRPHRHHRRDAGQQPAVAVRGDRVPAADDPLRRLARKDRRGDRAGQRDGGARGHGRRSCSARSSTRR